MVKTEKMVTTAKMARMVEMENFNEQQNVRRSLGPALWNNICNEFDDECRNLNSVEKRFQVERKPLMMMIRDLQTGRVLRLRYEDLTGLIAYESGHEKGNITFRVDTTPAPSLMCLYNGIPFLPRDLVMDFMFAFVNP